MKEYLSVLVCVCAASGLVRAVSPEGTGKKYIEMICSLCVIIAISVPLVSGIFGLADMNERLDAEGGQLTENYGEIYNSFLREGEISAAEKSLGEGLAAYVGAQQDTLRVKIEYEQNEGKTLLTGAKVYILPKAISASPEKIKEYIKNALGVECEIIYISDEKQN